MIKPSAPSFAHHIIKLLLPSLIILQLITLGITAWLILKPMMMNNIEHHVIDIETQLAQHKPNDTSPFRVSEIVPLALGGVSMRPFIWLLSQRLSEHLNMPVTQHTDTDNINRYWLKVDLQNHSYYVSFDQSVMGTYPLPVILILTISLFILSVLTALLLANQLKRPMLEITQATQKISLGDFSKQDTQQYPTQEFQTLAHNLNRMSQQLSDMMTERTTLLAGISHDIRTPITRLQLLVGIHEDELPQSFVAQYTAQLDNITSLLALFLDASQGIQASEIPQVSIELNNFLMKYVQKNSHHQRIRLRLSPNENIQCFSPLALERVINNLVDNAAKYSEYNIDIRLEMRAENTLIHIEDQGIGIPAESLNKVRLPFVRLATQQQGHGLGLSIVDQICLNQGWQLSLHNRQPHGLSACLQL
jgi:two-component system osmolarity sensor histidine kinase EnvZ